jgi:hypothetical protein
MRPALAGLTRFIDDGCIEIDNNTVERSIRPIKLNRKNALFAGSDGGVEHWAVIASLIEPARRRPAQLSNRRPHQDRQRPSKQRDRSALALGLSLSRTQSCGLRTTLTSKVRSR